MPCLSHQFLHNKLLSTTKLTRFAISARGPLLWNNCLSKEEKEIDNFLLFKKRAKEKIMELSTATSFFPVKRYSLCRLFGSTK